MKFKGFMPIATALGICIISVGMAWADNWKPIASAKLQKGAATKVVFWKTSNLQQKPKLLIVNTSQHCIQLFDTATDSVYTIAGKCAEAGDANSNEAAAGILLNNPLAALPITDDSFLVADTGNERILKVSSSGAQILELGTYTPQKLLISDMACNQNTPCNIVYATNLFKAQVLKIDIDNNNQTSVVLGSGEYGFSETSTKAKSVPLGEPVGIATMRNDNGNMRIFVVDADARILRMVLEEDSQSLIIAGNPFDNPLSANTNDGTPAAFANLGRPFRVSVLPYSDGVCITDPPRKRVYQYSLWDGNIYSFDAQLNFEDETVLDVEFEPNGGAFMAVSTLRGDIKVFARDKQKQMNAEEK